LLPSDEQHVGSGAAGVIGLRHGVARTDVSMFGVVPLSDIVSPDSVVLLTMRAPAVSCAICMNSIPAFSRLWSLARRNHPYTLNPGGCGRLSAYGMAFPFVISRHGIVRP